MIAKIPSKNNYCITNIDELTHFITTLELNTYMGFSEESKIPTRVFSSNNPIGSIIIEYDDVFDCKKTEIELKKHCSKFIPRKYDTPRMASIGLTYGCKKELTKLKQDNESYEFVIWRLILEHKSLI